MPNVVSSFFLTENYLVHSHMFALFSALSRGVGAYNIVIKWHDQNRKLIRHGGEDPVEQTAPADLRRQPFSQTNSYVYVTL